MERNTKIIIGVIVVLFIIWFWYRSTKSNESFTSVYDQISGSDNCNYLIIPDSTSNEASMDSTNAHDMCKSCDGCGVCSNQIDSKNISECVKGGQSGPSDSRIFCKSYQYKNNQPIINSSSLPTNNYFYGDKSKRMNNYCSAK
jgi:hypothetical protein